MYSKTYQRRKLGSPNFSIPKSEDSVIGVSPATEVDESKIRVEEQTQTYQINELAKPNSSTLKSKDSVIGVSPAMEVEESKIRGREPMKTYQRNELAKPNSSSLKSKDSVIGVSPAMEVDQLKIRANAPTKTYQRKKFRKPNFSSVESKDSVAAISPTMNVDESGKRGEAKTLKVDVSEKRGEAPTQNVDESENPSHSVPQSPPQKKTRDLPNLTECHSCGFKVDVCSGKNRLRTLYSEWRIVLLCYKCLSSVKSSKICSYCFSGTTTESFNCKKCRHSVHRSCFFNHKNVAPWSYACLGSEFSVCVDCWIPKSIELSRRRLRIRKIKNGMVEKKGRVVLKKGGSRVLGDENLERSMEDVANDANCVVEKNVEAAAKAGDAAMKKAVMARKAVNLVNNALSLVANTEEEGSLKLPPKLDTVNVVGGSKLMFNLHPHLNRSYLTCSVDSSSKTSNSRNASGSDDKDKVSNEDNEDSHKSLSKPSVCIGSLNTGSSTDLNCLCVGGSDMETSPKDGECPAEFDILEIGEELLKEGEGCSDRLINLNGEDGGLELDHKQSDSVLHGVERHGGRPDRYVLKYYRRRKCLKPNP